MPVRKKAVKKASAKKATVKKSAKKAASKKKAAAKKPKMVCSVCGLEVIVNKACGCEDTHSIVCCGIPMNSK